MANEQSVGGAANTPPFPHTGPAATAAPAADRPRAASGPGHRPNPLFARIADQLEELASRLEEFAEPEPARATSPAGLAHSAADSLVEVADYLRESSLPSLHRDLESRVRARPYQSLAVAFGTGWLLGKILR